MKKAATPDGFEPAVRVMAQWRGASGKGVCISNGINFVLFPICIALSIFSNAAAGSLPFFCAVCSIDIKTLLVFLPLSDWEPKLIFLAITVLPKSRSAKYPNVRICSRTGYLPGLYWKTQFPLRRQQTRRRNRRHLYEPHRHLQSNSVNPHEYLKDILTRINSHPFRKLAELLPHNWKAAPEKK